MKKRLAGAVLALSVAASGAGAQAAGISAGRLAGLAGLTTAAAQTARAGASRLENAPGPAAQENKAVAFRNLEKVVRAGNPSIKAFGQTIGSISVSGMGDAFQMQGMMLEQQIAYYNQLLDSLSSAAASASNEALRSTYEAHAKILGGSVAQMQATLAGLPTQAVMTEAQLGQVYGTTKKNLEHVADQLVMGAESCFITLRSLEYAAAGLDRNLAALDRQLELMRTQLEIGLASPVDQMNLQKSRDDLASARKTLENQRQALASSLAMLCGYGTGAAVYPTGLPALKDTELRAMKYEDDLAEALANSYTVWQKRDQVRQVSNQVMDGVESTKITLEAARAAVTAEQENVAAAFKPVFDAVAQKKTLMDAAKRTAEQQAANLEVKKLQYERGTLSRLEYLAAQDELAAAQDAIKTAEIDLFSAYNQYQWAKRGVMDAGG